MTAYVMESLSNNIPCITSRYIGLHNTLDIESIVKIRISSDQILNLDKISSTFNSADALKIAEIHNAKRAEIFFTELNQALKRKRK